MIVRVAINGLGRIGRMVFRLAAEDPAVEIVAINDRSSISTLAYLLKYDSLHGRYPGVVRAEDGCLVVDGKTIPVSADSNPSNLPWKDLEVDCVVECTGAFRTGKLASQHIAAGAKKVLVSAPCRTDDGSEPVKSIVMGINEHTIDKNKDLVLSNASCTTNCAAPIFKVLNDNFKVLRGYLTTVHAYTADQRLVDGPHKDPRRGRSAAFNLVPTTTGAAKAVTEIIPELKGEIDGIAIRAPVADGSFTDITVEVAEDVAAEQIKDLFRSVSENHLKHVLEYTEDPIVSSDIIGNRNSVIVDGSMIKVVNKRLVKVFGWYDNEWGYSARMIDVIKLMF